MDACKDTLCKYPAVDGLKCQFMEAYAESCRLKANVSLGDWRSKVNCCKILVHFLLVKYHHVFDI